MKRTWKPFPAFEEKQGPPPRPCDHPGCTAGGEFRAPKSRDHLSEYYWFCLDHVREYNRAWNYYAGLSDDQVERLVREDLVGHRPTWPLGHRTSQAYARAAQGDYGDAFEFFEQAKNRHKQERAGHQRPADMGHAEEKALDQLDLSWPVTFDDVRRRYKELVKVLHPDANGGDHEAEERLKLVNHAYSTLKNSHVLRNRVGMDHAS